MTVYYDTVWWDLQYRPIRWSSESEKLLSVAYHSENSNFYLGFGPDTNYLYICRRDTPQLSFKLPSNGLAEFIRNQPKDYLDGERLSCSITITEYLIDYTTGDTIHRFHSGSNLRDLCLGLDTSSLLCVKRVDHELASYSLKTGELLWYLRFSDFRARRVCGCGGVIHSNCYLYLDIYGTHQPGGRLAFTFLNHEFYIDDETKFLLLDNECCFQEKDEDDDTKVMMIHVPTKKKKKKTTKKSIKSVTENNLISECQTDKSLVTDITNKDDAKVISVLAVPSKKKNRRAKKTTERNTTANTNEKTRKELNEPDHDDLISQCDGDKDVETEVQISEVPDPNYNHVGFHFVKLDSRYLVSKRFVCSLHYLMLLANNGPGQAQLPANVIKAMEFFLEPYNWVKLTRDIAEELAKLHKNGNVHGDLNPHNVYIDIDNNAIIPKDLNADMSSSSEDADSSHSKEVDCYNMGRLILYIVSNGKHEFCDASKNDMNNLKDREDLELIKDEAEAYDIASRLLHRNPLLRPTAAFVCSHLLHWDDPKCRSYFEDACDQIKDKNINVELINNLESINKDVFYGTWDSEIHGGLLQEKNDYRRNNGFNDYDCTSMFEFLLFIRNVCGHYSGIPDGIKNTVGGDRDQFVNYIRGLYPKLLIEVYKVFDGYNWEGTILHEYHTS